MKRKEKNIKAKYAWLENRAIYLCTNRDLLGVLAWPHLHNINDISCQLRLHAGLSLLDQRRSANMHAGKLLWRLEACQDH